MKGAGERGSPSGLSIASLGSALSFVIKGPPCSSLRFSFLIYEAELARLLNSCQWALLEKFSLMWKLNIICRQGVRSE